MSPSILAAWQGLILRHCREHDKTVLLLQMVVMACYRHLAPAHGATLHSKAVTELSSAQGQKEIKNRTYNRRDSQMVTHSSTSRPVQCLCMAERTGCPVFTDLWSYVLE
jgi:hypothetical protein